MLRIWRAQISLVSADQIGRKGHSAGRGAASGPRTVPRPQRAHEPARILLSRPPGTFPYLAFHTGLMGGEDGTAFPPAGGKAVERTSSLPSARVFDRYAGSQRRSCPCPELEPLTERPITTSSHLQE